jgi:hypothetical protein
MPVATLMLPALPGSATAQPEECSTVVATGDGTLDGRPLLWKNRDTDQLHNRVVFVDEKPYPYLALVDDDDSSGRVAWVGVNAAGFAICNSVAYNLPAASGTEMEDLEGMVMADALRTCATAADFEAYLEKRLGSQLGCRTNFCVIDAAGNAVIFEVFNRGYRKFSAADAPEKYLVNTNYSRSGTPNRGSGYLRFERESRVLAAAPGGKLSAPYILQFAARDLGHTLLRHPERATWRSLPADSSAWLHTNHTINRPSTAAAVVIRGVRRGEAPGGAVMWVILGEPVMSVALPLWVNTGKVPAPLRSGAVCGEAMRLKDIARPFAVSDKREYLDLTKLDNRAGTGWLPKMLAEEGRIFAETEQFLKNEPGPAEKAAFQDRVADRVLSLLKGIR